ncbi:phage head closure protein [Testudinibacter aquarius]|uniref:Head-tail adaptor protein n=1 Tax=Testudinibacter aquarius TaxID=1524974 RepID=A0A4R3Y4B5_9PAST|nr:phage head closure protein [Testudinibacter aquarius]KAE9527924.1 phage head-tail adapter protein [Testudinibacter aquarius]TCV86527.1 SPP1 family predicted phage head-tail adaptor [Testudinibacter aquarius]TNG93587.1 head-tail adaptor protein [Testudinibacter aquarius]
MARMISAGRYNKQVAIQRPIHTAGNYGQHTTQWEDVTTVHAAVEPLQGREYFSGPYMMGENIIRVRIRYQPNITNKMRLKYGERILAIYSVIDSRESHREIQLMCKEGEAYAR